MFKYAQLDSTGKVIGVSSLSGEVIADDLIRIEDDFSPWGKRYDKVKNSWEDVPVVEQEPQEPQKTLEEKVDELLAKEQENQLNQEAIMMAITDLYEIGGLL